MNNSVETARQAVQCKLGRCLIRLQEYERLLKGLVLVSGPEQASEPHSAILGRLMGTLAGIAPQDAPACAHFRFEMGPDALDATEKGLAELVSMRDELVHRFSERFDTDQVAGCTAAEAYLDECNAKVDGHLLTLRVWAAVIDEARASLPLFAEMSEAEAQDIAKYLERFKKH